MMILSAGSRAGQLPHPWKSPLPEYSKPSQLLLACHMLKDWNERKHCIVLGCKEHGGVGRVGSQSPRPPPAAWLNSGRKEVKAAALQEELRFPTLSPIRAHSVSCGPLSSGLLCKGLNAPLTGGCISAIGTALPAPLHQH